MSILLLKPESTNGVLPNLTQKLFDQLQGITPCTLFDEATQPLSKSAFFNYVEQINPKAIFSFNSAGAELELMIPNQGNKNLFSLFPSLHIGWMVDHPVYHIHRLSQVNPKRLVLFPSQESIPFAEDFKLSGVFSSLPFAGSHTTSMGKDHKDRKFDVVIAASWMGFPEEITSRYAFPVTEVIDETISVIQQKTFLDPYCVLLDSFLGKNLECESKAFLGNLTKELYDYQRKFNRVTMIDAIVNSGLRIALVGRGWQSYFGMRDNVTYFDAMTHREITKLYQDTKVVVNVNAVNGASERLFDAIDSGAMVYSEFSMMLYDMFGSGNGVLFHNTNAQESSITLLTNIIKSNETESWALSAKESVRSAHTWKHRAIYLNQLVNAFSLA